MDPVALLGRAVDEVSRLVEGLDDDQYGKPTPCSEWKVRDLLNHLVGGTTMFAVSAETGDVPDELMASLMSEDQLGDDPKQAWKASSARALAAFSKPGIMEQTVKLPFGEMPAGIAATIGVFDVTTHACDLAQATGQQVQDTDLIETALETGKQMIGPDMRVPGMFGPERPCAESASSVDKLLAFAGRQPQPTA